MMARCWLAVVLLAGCVHRVVVPAAEWAEYRLEISNHTQSMGS